MSRFFSNKYLKYRAALQGGVIDRDRSCEGCGYNLRGLKLGGQCPECGASIRVEALTRDTLSDVPLPDLRRLRLGFGLGMACLPLLLVAPLGAMLAIRQAGAPSTVLLVVTIAWVIAVRLMTPVLPTAGGQRRGFCDASRLRRWARWLQIGWPLLVGLAFLVPAWPGAGMPLRVAGWIAGGLCGVAALAGTVLLALLFIRLAEWCDNDYAEKMLNWSVWGLSICSVGLVLAGATVLFRLFTYTFIVWWMMAFLCFFAAVFSLGRSVRWSMVHAKERLARDLALRQRVQRSREGGAPA